MGHVICTTKHLNSSLEIFNKFGQIVNSLTNKVAKSIYNLRRWK